MTDVMQARLEAQSEKLDAVHLSLEKDISELKGLVLNQNTRISKSELRLAQIQGMGVALTLVLPFAAVGLSHLLG
jgi:hypothetical protein